MKRTVLRTGIGADSGRICGFTLILVIFGCFSPQASLGQGSINQAPPSEQRSDHAFIATIKSKMPTSLDTDSVPGAAVALIHNGVVVWTEGFGWADVAGKIRVSPETIFNVGSLSKQLAGVPPEDSRASTQGLSNSKSLEANVTRSY